MENNLQMKGELETVFFSKGEGKKPNSGPRTYPDFYEPDTIVRVQKRSVWNRMKIFFHSWNLSRKMKNGTAVRGRTSESD